MASEVYTTETVKLLDGTQVTLRPLPLAKLRKFMKRWGEYQKWVGDNIAKESDDRPDDDEFADKQFEAFLDLMEICLTELRGDKNDDDYRDYLENTLDEHTVVRVLYKCGGLQVGSDPNLTSPAAQAGTT